MLIVLVSNNGMMINHKLNQKLDQIPPHGDLQLKLNHFSLPTRQVIVLGEEAKP